MRYAVLIYENPEDFAMRDDPEKKDSYWSQWPPYSQAMKEEGIFVTGSALQAPSTCRSLRVRDGKSMIVDGPFAETKEQLGGFVIIDVPDMEAALKWAARCPRAPYSVMEVRPVLPGSCSSS